MSKKYFLLVAFIFAAFVSFAQTGKITGKVLNSKNEPLQGVSIKVTGAPGGTTSDVEGRFTLSLSTDKNMN
ncbi:carboxypeptidase-like regulatory domain-containing protein [Paraflavitalea speifideaquila]|uniref:carboxypeptidase-like regulatory domain-containing protein n=1 Tax=Paraflavitalea speifideaquila TaxID=3076558 RepID=UPI0028E304BF|nr:carboxypeptidase-like regulatory domain-containing protein [Paraflavitalea speifideiaquila]